MSDDAFREIAERVLLHCYRRALQLALWLTLRLLALNPAPIEPPPWFTEEEGAVIDREKYGA